MKKIFLIITIISSLLMSNTQKEDSSLWQDAYNYITSDTKEKLLPFAYYINEAGLMLGAFYYNTDLYRGSKFTAIGIWSPSTHTAVFQINNEELKISNKFTFTTKFSLITFNDIRIFWPGNDSKNEEQEYIPNAGGNIVPKNLGYKKLEGLTGYFDNRLNYYLNPHNLFSFGYVYESAITEHRDYLSDCLVMSYENRRVDNVTMPKLGYRAICSLEKSLNLLGHDSENDWDYYKLDFDLRGYIPLSESIVLSLRGQTVFTGGKKVVDKERSSLEQFITGNPKAEVSSVAPFFDEALLGDLNNFRGYYYYRFRDNHMLLFQTELRFPLYKGLMGVLFLENGRVIDSYKIDKIFTDHHISYGGGLRYAFNKEILVRADLGHSKEESLQVRVNLGHSF